VNTSTTLNLESLLGLGISSAGPIGINSVSTVDIYANAQLGIGAGGITNLDGTLVNIGNGTSALTSGASFGTIVASKAAQTAVGMALTQKVPNISLEIAKVVKPQEITNTVTPTLKAKVSRWWQGLTGLMGSNDDE
jgi:hypothetical protein